MRKILFVLSGPGHEGFTKTIAAVFNQIEGQLKGLRSAIIRVGHGGRLMMPQIVGKQNDFTPNPALSLSKALETTQIVVVHCHDEVETVKVGHTDRPRVVGESVASGCSVVAHTAVGKFAFVIVNHTGRVYDVLVRHAGLGQLDAHHFLGSRRPTDIAQANEKDVFHKV